MSSHCEDRLQGKTVAKDDSNGTSKTVPWVPTCPYILSGTVYIYMEHMCTSGVLITILVKTLWHYTNKLHAFIPGHTDTDQESSIKSKYTSVYSEFH